MNILVFSWRDPKHPLAGGAEQVMHEHMKGWIKAGHKITLFSSTIKGLEKEEVLDGVRIIRAGYQYLGVQIYGFFYYLSHKPEYDFVVDQFHGLPFLTPLYVSTRKLAVIQETARKVWFLNPFPWPINWLIGFLGYIGEPFIFLLYRSSKFMTGSESAKKDVSKLGRIPEKNITVIPHGVIVDKTKLGKKRKTKTITFLGVLSKDKGIEDALRCFSILSRKNNYDFGVIGKPETEEYFERVKNLVKKLGLQGRVKFWGFVNQQKKFELLSKSHFLINPSVHEGWGLVNIEANSVGTPVIAYNVSGSIDSVKNLVSGILCDKNTPEELAKNVERILSDQITYTKLVKGSLSWSRNFSWRRSTKLSLNLIESICAKG